MYCCRTYNYYGGIPLPPRKKPSLKKTSPIGKTDEEIEAERAAAIDAIEKELADIDLQIEELQAQCEDLLIPLINVEIVSNKHGTGTVVEQSENNIVVQYPDIRIKMVLGNVFKTAIRPIFENDDEVWNTFANYTSIKDRISKMNSKREADQEELEKLESRQ